MIFSLIGLSFFDAKPWDLKNLIRDLNQNDPKQILIMWNFEKQIIVTTSTLCKQGNFKIHDFEEPTQEEICMLQEIHHSTIKYIQIDVEDSGFTGL